VANKRPLVVSAGVSQEIPTTDILSASKLVIQPASDASDCALIMNAAGAARFRIDTTPVTGVAGKISACIDAVTLGTEKVTNGTFDTDLAGWTYGGGSDWAWNSGTAKHATGNTTPITQDITISTGDIMEITIATTGRTSGTLTVAVAGCNGSAAITADGTTYFATAAAATGARSLSFTPTSTFDGAIDSVTIKSITAIPASFAVCDTLETICTAIRGYPIAKLSTSIGNSTNTMLYQGSEVTGLGGNALQYAVNLTKSVGIGKGALQYAHNGIGETAVGCNAASSASAFANANYNTAIGYQAMQLPQSTPVSNTAIGTSAGYRMGGTQNVALGAGALMGGAAGVSGSNSIGIGMYSLYSLTSGGSNLAFGFSTGFNLTTGVGNILIGDSAGYAINSSCNTVTGYGALYSGTANIECTAIGYQAAKAITGSYNTMLGSKTALAATSLTYSVVIGNNAIGAGIATGIGTIAIGYQSANALTSSEYGVHIGYQAGINVTTGNGNCFVGQKSGYQISTTGYNTAIGYQSLYSGAGSQYGVHVGAYAGMVTTGSYNTFLGSSAAAAATSLTYAVAIGYQAMSTGVATGVGSIAIGYYSGNSLTSSNYSVLVGTQAGKYITAADYNIGIGYQALYGAAAGMTGHENIGMGYACGYSLTNGSHNLLIGTNAGNLLTVDIGTIAIGDHALAVATTADYNTVIGFEAGKNSIIGTECTIVGYQSGTGTGGHNTFMGAWAGDTGAAGSGGYNVGIGNLAMGGTGDTTAYCVAVGVNALMNFGAAMSGGYNIGIGPNAFGNITSGAYNIGLGSSVALAAATNSYAIAIGASAVAASDSIAIGRAATAAANQFVAGGTASAMTDVYFGKGVTNASPTTWTLNGTGGSGTNIAGGAVSIAGGRGTGSGIGGPIYFKTSSAGASGDTLRDLVERGRIDDQGNCGLGITSFGTSAAKVFSIGTGTAPGSSIADSFQIYSADQTAGNACLHTRSEAGHIVKLYRQAHIADPTGGATMDTEARTAINAILVVLENLGELATS